MAQPIRKTPTLTGENASIFISNMVKTEKRKINKNEQEIVNLIKVD